MSRNIVHELGEPAGIVGLDTVMPVPRIRDVVYRSVPLYHPYHARLLDLGTSGR